MANATKLRNFKKHLNGLKNYTKNLFGQEYKANQLQFCIDIQNCIKDVETVIQNERLIKWEKEEIE